jgi:hypothetical protein
LPVTVKPPGGLTCPSATGNCSNAAGRHTVMPYWFLQDGHEIDHCYTRGEASTH